MATTREQHKAKLNQGPSNHEPDATVDKAKTAENPSALSHLSTEASVSAISGSFYASPPKTRRQQSAINTKKLRMWAWHRVPAAWETQLR